MASRVYVGMPGNGDLFAGMKFCILLRVPIRSTLIQNVESNGGEVVPLEKNADMVIADDARPKHAPPNSYSWKYIEQSVKNGKLEDKEKHLINSTSTSNGSPASRTPGHKAGGSRPTTTTRTDYTKADDDFLLEWVAKAKKQGMAVGGNLIYKQLENVNPRHPYQSWRDRYIKFHQGKPLPDVSNDDSLGPVNEPVNHQRSRPQAVRQANGAESDRDDDDEGEDQESSAPHNVSTRVEAAPNQTPRIVEGEEFTEADHDLVETEYEHILEIETKRVNIVDAWNAFAELHGRHTAGEWYKYYSKVVAPVMERKLQNSTNAGKQQHDVITIDGDDDDLNEEQDLEGKLQKSTTSETSKPDIIAIDDDDEETGADEDMCAIDVDLPQHSINDVPARVLLSRSPNVSSSRREEESRKPSSAHKQLSASVHDKEDEYVSEEKAAFLDDLRTIARATHKQIEPRQEVCGVQLQLYDLWSTVIDKFEGVENVEAGDMWGRVASHLGFNISKHPGVATELRNLYTLFLVKVARVDQVSSADVPKGVPKATATVAHATTREQQKIDTIAPLTEQGALPSSDTDPLKIWSLKKTARHSDARPKDTTDEAEIDHVSETSDQRAAAKSDTPSISGKASITSKSLPTKTAVGAPLGSDLQVTAVQKEDIQAAEFFRQHQTVVEFLQSSTIGNVQGANEEELTPADWVMWRKLVDFAKDCLKIQIDVTGSAICGRWVSLPKFQEVVNGLGGYNTVARKMLWKQVAVELGYKEVGKYQGVAEELQDAYEDVLMHYDDYCRQVREERERRVSKGVQGLNSADENSGVAVPHTSPRQGGSSSSQKRNRSASRHVGSVTVPDTFKRRRVDRKGKGKEIQHEVPGTPEHIYNSSMLSQEASVVKDSQMIELSSDSESDATEAYQPIKRPLFQKAATPQAQTAVEEPETQEFSFMEVDSPSQQLNSEAMASTSPALTTRKRAAPPFEDDELVQEADPVNEYFKMCDDEGYEREVAVLAFSAANMKPLLAPKILSRLAKGRPIPDNIRGVWTSKDDDIMLRDLPANHPDMVKLIKKHGSEELKDRMDFLENLGQTAEDE